MTKSPIKYYMEKWDFEKTPEPREQGARSRSGQRFVIHEHDSNRHHFDLRLEVDGALKSWAVPRGPSMDPKEKRLAVEVEDHPLDYGDFEGVILEGEYGAGAVIAWDNGFYENPRKDKNEEPIQLSECLDEGRVEIRLSGKKVQGGCALVRTKFGGKGKNWLLIKMKDGDADARRNPVSTEPRSVLSGRTVKELTRDGVG
jgi:DNA ligase D-like protein (predicted 3'-phosphoesterase)